MCFGMNAPVLFGSIHFQAIGALPKIKRDTFKYELTTEMVFCSRELYPELLPLLTTMNASRRVTTPLAHTATTQAHQADLVSRIRSQHTATNKPRQTGCSRTTQKEQQTLVNLVNFIQKLRVKTTHIFSTKQRQK